MDKKKYNEYYKVVTNTESSVPEVFLYGYIGQKADEWFGGDPEEDITDLAVVKAIRDLEQKYSRINIRINSPGGSVMHGDPIISALLSSKAEIHTYNDGIAASMAADIWIAGHVRHASINSKLMIHATASAVWGTAKDHRSAADMLDKFDSTAISTFAAATGLDEDMIRSEYYDYSDHWITAKELQKLGLITEVESYSTKSPIDEPEKMNWRALLDSAARLTISEPAPAGFEQDAWREDHLRRLNFIIQNHN
jgi:ATP-dependent Clp protease, protease subunit